MSYAEHGSRIFMTGKFSSNPLLRYGDYVVPRKRSEGRLKLFDSCSDLRAWSPNVLENCRYFRDIVENPTPAGRIVPYDVLIESLILLGQAELPSVRRQLEKYKSLRLTPEQEKELRDMDENTEDQSKTDDSTLTEESRTVEDDSGVPKRPGTPIQSICSSSSNFQDIEIDNESFTDNSERSKEVFISSDTNEDVNVQNDDRSIKRYQTFQDDNHQGIIIKKDSKIIELENELGAKEAELEEMREICKNLESSMNEKESMLNNLRTNLNISQEQLLGMADQLYQQKEECKKKLYTSKCFVDHLKNTLAEKSQEGSVHCKEIQDLRERMKDTETIRQERDSLARKLDEMNIVLHERNDLIKLNKQQAINLEDQEDEINRLLEFIERESTKHNERQMKMKVKLDDLRSELEAKSSMISHFEAQNLTLRTNTSPSQSLSEVPTFEIKKLKRSLQEDLETLENELATRQKVHKDDNCKQDEASRSKSATDRINETTIQRGNWERDKYFELSKELMECTIEQLTMQVSASNAASEEQEKIFTAFSTSRDQMQRLIVELEPYVEERSSFIENIQYLKEALEDARRVSESRDIINQKEYLSNLVNKHKKECVEYAKRIASLENKLEESRKKCTKLSERVRREKDDIMDNEIDDALAMHTKRSIDKVMKISADLRGTIIIAKNHSTRLTQDNRIVSLIGGAGDEIGREMAKRRDELEAKNVEIAKLKGQVAFNASRGQQGDLVINENLDEIGRLKKAKKLLVAEITRNRDSLRTTKDELQSSEFKMKGATQRIKDLWAQCKQREREIQLKIQQIERLEKENEGLNKTVLITNDLAMEGDEMKLKLESLQEENSRLMEENSRMIKRCADYEDRLVDLTNRELQAKEVFDQAAFHWQELILKRESEYESWESENETLVKELEENKLKVAKLTEENKSLRKNTKKLDMIENWTAEISKLDEDRKRLHDHVASLRRQLENDDRLNDKLEDDLRRKLDENVTLENTIRELRKNIEREKIPDKDAKKLLENLPIEICEQFETFRKQLNSSESEGNSRKREIDEWKAKSLKHSLIIEKLRDEIKLYKNKILEQDKTIIGLEGGNVDLTKKLEKIVNIENSAENKLQPSLEYEIDKMEMEIAKRDRDIIAKNDELKNLTQRLQSLINENKELGDQLRNEKDLHRTNLTELQKKYQSRERTVRDQHNDSVKKIVAKYEEVMKNTSNPFDSETWLRSLTMKEMAELQKRISSLTLCEVTGEATKNRALNDKQNQQLQQDEKLHTDILCMKNGHRKDEAIGYPYMYERRKFELPRHKAVETSFNDNTFDTQRMNFIHQCAIQHKYDSSH